MRKEVDVARPNRPPSKKVLKAFEREYGFTSAWHSSLIPNVQRLLELKLVADHLSDLWWKITTCQQALMQRDPPDWLRAYDGDRMPKRKRIEERLQQLEAQYANAEKLARPVGLHPEGLIA